MDRVFIPNADTRNLLKNFISIKKQDGFHAFDELKVLIEKHQPSLLPLLLHLEEIGKHCEI